MKVRSRTTRLVFAIGVVLALSATTAFVALHDFTHRTGISLTETALPVGWVDVPASEGIFSTTLDVSGWAFAPGDVKAVQIRMGSRTFLATLGVERPDVSTAHHHDPKFSKSGFAFHRSFNDLPLQRQPFTIVAVGKSGLETVLGHRSVIPPAAMSLWSDVGDIRSTSPFYFLMATSGVARGGAEDILPTYRGYVSSTQRIGVSVPVLYLRTTRGRSGDWEFDPNFDTSRKCGVGPIAEDSLAEIFRFATGTKTPIQFILNGGIWADATCDTPEWDLNDHLEEDEANVQWTQDNRTFPDDYLKNLTGSTASPELARSLTLNVYAKRVRDYKKRNLQQAVRLIAHFAREHPELFVGVNLDADTYINPFFEQREWFDYNPGSIRQFREWLQAIGPYSRARNRDSQLPNLDRFTLRRPLSLDDVNRIAHQSWKSWAQVEPPRSLPRPGDGHHVANAKIWDDPWFRLWDQYRKQLVAIHYGELAQWTHEAGIPKDRIFTAQGFVAPDEGAAPFALRIDSGGQNYDSGGVSVEGAIPLNGHLGAILYGRAARNDARMQERHGIFATFARADPDWAVVESNLTDLKRPQAYPSYADAYRTFRDLFNFGARQISVMAWNGSNGIFAGQPDYVAYTSWRNTPAEQAMRDYLVSHAGVPRGSHLWTFGSARHADDDGWSTSGARVVPMFGRLVIEPFDRQVTFASPADQVIRKKGMGTLVLGVSAGRLKGIEVSGQLSPDGRWEMLGAAKDLQHLGPGLEVPLTWPAVWSAEAIAERIRIAVSLDGSAPPFEVQRIAILPTVAK